jgi:predicted MFS family arabinose efflux permease
MRAKGGLLPSPPESAAPMESWRALAALPRDCWTLSFVSFVNRTGSMVMAYLVLYYGAKFGFKEDAVAPTLFLCGLAGVLTSPFAGRAADRFGPAPVIRASLLWSGVALVVTPFLGSPAAATAALVAFSSLNEFMRPASLSAITTMTPPEQRRSAYLLHRLAINLGQAFGSGVGGYVAKGSTDALFWLDGGTSLVAFGLLALLPFSASNRASADGRRTPGPILPFDVLRDGRFSCALLACLPAFVSFFQILGPLTVYVTSHLKYGPEVVGWIFVVNTLLICFVEIPLNYRTNRWSHRTAVTVGCALYAVGFGAYAFTESVPALLAATVVWTFGEMILFPSLSDYVADIAPAARRGAYMGWYSMSFGVSNTIGPWLGLHVLHDRGPGFLWLSTGVACAVSTLALARVIRRAPAPVSS